MQPLEGGRGQSSPSERGPGNLEAPGELARPLWALGLLLQCVPAISADHGDRGKQLVRLGDKLGVVHSATLRLPSTQPSARCSASAVKFRKDSLVYLCSSLNLRPQSLVISVLDDLTFFPEFSNSEIEVRGRGWSGRGQPAAWSL